MTKECLGILGFPDDVRVVAWLYNKIGSKNTPDIELKADMKLDEWFGPKIVKMLLRLQSK